MEILIEEYDDFNKETKLTRTQLEKDIDTIESMLGERNINIGTILIKIKKLKNRLNGKTPNSNYMNT